MVPRIGSPPASSSRVIRGFPAMDTPRSCDGEWTVGTGCPPLVFCDGGERDSPPRTLDSNRTESSDVPIGAVARGLRSAAGLFGRHAELAANRPVSGGARAGARALVLLGGPPRSRHTLPFGAAPP